MVLTIKRRFGIYKRFEKDIWGLSFSNFNATNKVTQFFSKLYLEKQEYSQRKRRRYVYRIDIIKPTAKKKMMKWRFVSLRLLKLFFLTLQYRQFRRIARVSMKKDGLFQNHFCANLEGRIVSFIYRTNFMYNMFEIITFVKHANVYVDGVLIDYVNYVVRVGQFVTFKRGVRRFFRHNLIRRFRTKGVIFNSPRYMFVNFKLFFAFMERYPFNRDLAYPIKLDVYRANAYF